MSDFDNIKSWIVDVRDEILLPIVGSGESAMAYAAEGFGQQSVSVLESVDNMIGQLFQCRQAILKEGIRGDKFLDAINKICVVMARNSLSTGHGDNLDELCSELDWQLKEKNQLLADTLKSLSIALSEIHRLKNKP